ncbi:MAG: hypothetical protein M9942_12960 [Microthrixaceae bacterium]|nr:hypothetical protein [Microthrixaceae bacterium]
MDEYAWLWAAIAVGVGILFGQIGGRLARASIGRANRDEHTRASALAVSRGIFWGSTAVGLAIAAGILDRDGLEEYAEILRDGLPRVLVAIVLAIGGYAVAIFVAKAVGQAAREATGVRQLAMERAIKLSIFALAVVIALVVAGVGRTVLVVVLVALVGAPSLALALLTANGARGVASQLSAGRALRHRFEEGWHLHVGDLDGEVTAMEATFVEVLDDNGVRHQLPNEWLLERPYRAVPRR